MLESLHTPIAEVESAWAQEIEERVAAFDRSEMQTYAAPDVIAEATARAIAFPLAGSSATKSTRRVFLTVSSKGFKRRGRTHNDPQIIRWGYKGVPHVPPAVWIRDSLPDPCWLPCSMLVFPWLPMFILVSFLRRR
ncbi:MAG: hypothetical protein ACFCVA_17365 [Gammaproteobacteria bacterium]